jgi:prepilin-type N-terminal cleavage/methylation domain-containing protein
VTRRRRGGDDCGFTLIELLVSIAIIGTVMASLTLFLVRTGSLSRQQTDTQAAAQIATSAMERVRLLTGSALLASRTRGGVQGQWRAPGVAPYLDPTKTQLTWDDPANPGPVPAQALPTGPEPVTIGGSPTRFSQSFYVGLCWEPPDTGECTVLPAAQQATAIPMYRVVVAVTWSSTDCAAGQCSYVTAVLVGRDLDDPTFR